MGHCGLTTNARTRFHASYCILKGQSMANPIEVQEHIKRISAGCRYDLADHGTDNAIRLHAWTFAVKTWVGGL